MAVNFFIKMKKLVFTKMSGAGNDFIVIDRKLNPDLLLTAEFINLLCNRRNAIGADGVLVIEDSVDHDFVMNYFNADGSTGSLCANGARCAIRFASESGRLKNDSARFLSNDIEYTGKILPDGLIQFFLNSPQKIKYNFKVKAANQLITANFADTGSPHIVIRLNDEQNRFDFLKSLHTVPVEELGREIRFLPEFSPGGANVNFISITDGEIRIRTYERGVEAETLSCGTGSVAAALVAYVTDGLRPPVKIITKENENLFVNFEVENQKVKNISLTGPAEIVYSGTMEIVNQIKSRRINAQS